MVGFEVIKASFHLFCLPDFFIPFSAPLYIQNNFFFNAFLSFLHLQVFVLPSYLSQPITIRYLFSKYSIASIYFCNRNCQFPLSLKLFCVYFSNFIIPPPPCIVKWSVALNTRFPFLFDAFSLSSLGMRLRRL